MKNLIIGILSIIFLGILVYLDKNDRKYITNDNGYRNQLEEFIDTSDVQTRLNFINEFKNPSFKFPREEVSKIVLFRNVFLISRLTKKQISKNSIQDLTDFFNNPNNFDWDETTWSLDESEYILRFYDEDNKLIGQIWICLEGCNMTFADPFTPNMKYGGLSKEGADKIRNLIQKQLNE